MQAAIQATKLWFKCPSTLTHSGKSVVLKIHLMNNALSDSYLIIEESTSSFCFIPVAPEIMCSFSVPDMTIRLKFSRYENMTLDFKLKEMQDLELLVSHFGKSSILLGYADDRFRNENVAFLRKLKPPTDLPKLSFYSGDIGGTTSLYPVVLNDSAREIWEARVREQNTQFYMKEIPLRFSFLTWNVASREPTVDVVPDMARAFRVPAASADIIVIGLEEIDMSFKSMVTGNSSACDKWGDIVQQAKKDAGVDYKVVASESMGGVYCGALVRQDLFPEVRDCHITTIKLGANGMFANKAAVLFRWKIGEASLVAICCHLAPHDQNWEQRNNQWHEIVERLGPNVDYIIFLGDLNYRIAVTYEQCKEMIAQGKLAELLEKDQLKTTQKTDPIIGKFYEPPIKFNPTYKFNKDSDVYDTSAKKRVPSYTDRILVKTSESRMRIGLEDVVMIETDAAHHYIKGDLFTTECNYPMQRKEPNYPRQPHCICYRMIWNCFSDHRPVNACYLFPIPAPIQDRLDELEDIARAKLDEMRALSVPKASAVPDVVAGGGSFELVNRCIVWVQWRVESVPQGCTFVPSEGVIMAGEKVVINVQGEEPGQAKIEVKGGETITVTIEN